MKNSITIIKRRNNIVKRLYNHLTVSMSLQLGMNQEKEKEKESKNEKSNYGKLPKLEVKKLILNFLYFDI